MAIAAPRKSSTLRPDLSDELKRFPPRERILQIRHSREIVMPGKVREISVV
jgi:hypothetical protein